MKYILFGAGSSGKNLLKILGKERVAFFVDSHISGIDIEGIKVYPPEELRKLYQPDDQIVICTMKIENAIEMSSFLTNSGLPFKLIEQVGNEIVFEEARKYNLMNPRETFVANDDEIWSCPWDRVNQNGTTDAYFWQDLWVAKRVFKDRPNIHFDIGSRIDGLIAHLLSFGQKVKVIDIRPMELDIEGLEFVCADATKMDLFQDDEIESLSAVCSVEHFGLGRYTDDIDPNACFDFLNTINKKIRKKGSFYITVPIGKERVQFNAHRIFNPLTIVNELNKMKLVEFSAYDKGRIIESADINCWNNVQEYGAIGLFHFIKE